MHLRPLMILSRDKNPTCTQIFLPQNVQNWQLTCPQTVRKKARSLKYNDIQKQSLTSNPILSARSRGWGYFEYSPLRPAISQLTAQVTRA